MFLEELMCANTCVIVLAHRLHLITATLLLGKVSSAMQVETEELPVPSPGLGGAVTGKG